MEGTMATIIIFAGNFAPRSWMYCDGSLLAISQYDALFALIGTTYGGDGIQTFALPDLRGRIPVGTGSGPGLNDNIILGQSAGSEHITMTQAQLPAHAHPMMAQLGTSSSNADGSKNPQKLLSNTPFNVYAPADPNVKTYLGGASVNLAIAGGNTSFSILQPYLAINYVICTEGIFPSRG
jgi:microcystin-dependent protein